MLFNEKSTVYVYEFYHFFSTNTSERHIASYIIFFSGFVFATAKAASITTIIYFHVTFHSAVHIYDFLIHNFTQMLFLANEPAKKAEINILTARDTTGPGF